MVILVVTGAGSGLLDTGNDDLTVLRPPSLDCCFWSGTAPGLQVITDAVSLVNYPSLLVHHNIYLFYQRLVISSIFLRHSLISPSPSLSS